MDARTAAPWAAGIRRSGRRRASGRRCAGVGGSRPRDAVEGVRAWAEAARGTRWRVRGRGRKPPAGRADGAPGRLGEEGWPGPPGGGPGDVGSRRARRRRCAGVGGSRPRDALTASRTPWVRSAGRGPRAEAPAMVIPASGASRHDFGVLTWLYGHNGNDLPAPHTRALACGTAPAQCPVSEVREMPESPQMPVNTGTMPRGIVSRTTVQGH